MAYAQEKCWFRIFDFQSLLRSARIAFAFLLFALVSPPILVAQSFETVDLEEINEFLEKVQTYREGYTNYRIKFREYTDNNLFIGELYYSKPDQLRITYYRGKNVVTEVFLGSEKLLVYFVDSAIVYEQENFNTYKSGALFQSGSLDYLQANYNFNFKDKNPVPVFTGQEYRFFNLTGLPQQVAYHLLLTPKNITEGLDDLELWFLAEEDGEGNYRPTQVIRSRLRSVTGTVSDIYFSPIELNQQFPVDIYQFVVPPNVRIIKNYLPALEEVDLGGGWEN